MKSVICFLFLSVTSSYGRVAITDDHKEHTLLANLLAKSNQKNFNDGKAYVYIDANKIPHATAKKPCSNGDEIDNNIDTTDKQPCTVEERVDNGTALILTPFIEEGRIAEARNACAVDPKLFLGFESYSGFLTVNKKYNSNLFFWYFPSLKKPVKDTPWIIWLQGGPGASSMTGLFDEIGPFRVSLNNSLRPNPYTWLQNHSLVFIDNPVGTGFSFTDHPEGLARDMDTYSKHLYKTVKQLVQIFPELRLAPLYVAGESYAGKYVPALAMEIHKHKNRPGLDINLKGLMLGNAYIEPAMIRNIARSFYNFGMLGPEQVDTIKPLIDAFQDDITANRSVEAKNKWTNLIRILLLLTNQKQAYNFLRDEFSIGRYIGFLKNSKVKKAIHVGDIHFGFVNITVNIEMAPDFLSTAKPMMETLLEHYNVLAYCGQLDQMLPCVFTSENYRTWQWNGSKDFIQATRYPYMFGKGLAGYHKTGGRLTEIVVRGAGHMVPMDTPAFAQTMAARWTHGVSPPTNQFSYLQGSYVQDFVKNNTFVYL